MHRFYVPELEDYVILSGEVHTHIAYSLRLRVGDQIVLFNGDGFNYHYKITSIKKNETEAEISERESTEIESPFQIHAFTALIKPEKMSLIYQKLTELGVMYFTPVITEYTQAGKKDFNIERYRKICIESCKQCGRSIVPDIFPPINFSNLPSNLDGIDLVIFAFEKATHSLKEYINKRLAQNKPIKNIALIIGPEGGFSKLETEKLESIGVTPVSLGKRILRAETAAIATTSAVLYELDW